MARFVAPLQEVREGFLAVQAWLDDRVCLLLVTTTATQTMLKPDVIEALNLPLLNVTPIHERIRRSRYTLHRGAQLGDYWLGDTVIIQHPAAGRFGVDGVLGMEWLAAFHRVCIDRQLMIMEMYTDE